jgi:ppGpp synthetase/RelA/SpoT-type nucleotidyltranferase
MIVPSELDATYQGIRPLINALAERVHSTISKFSAEHQFPTLCRIKALDSLSEKIETGRFKALSEIDDLVAGTIIVPTRSFETPVLDFCRGAFDVIEVRQRETTPKAPEVFRFDSIRTVCRLRKPEGADSSTQSIFDLPFEIQIRTALEHAWSVATHPLVYKTDHVNWKRIRLAAQLKALVEQMDSVLLDFDNLSNAIGQSPWNAIDDKAWIAEQIRELADQGLVPEEVRPKDLSRTAESMYSFLRSSNIKVEIRPAVEHIRAKIRNYDNRNFPRSISFFQLMIGLLVQDDIIAGPLKNYHCYVTREVVALFPKMAGIIPIFQCDG